MTLRGSGFEYEEIPITINEYNSFMDFKNREFPLEQNRRLYAWDILQKKQSDIPERIKGYIRQAFGDVSLGYAVLDDIVSKLNGVNLTSKYQEVELKNAMDGIFTKK